MKRFDMRNFEQLVLNQCLLFAKKKCTQSKKNVDCSVSPLLLLVREKKKEEQLKKKNTSKHFMFEERAHTRRRKRATVEFNRYSDRDVYTPTAEFRSRQSRVHLFRFFLLLSV